AAADPRPLARARTPRRRLLRPRKRPLRPIRRGHSRHRPALLLLFARGRDGCGEASAPSALIRAIIEIARSLRLDVVAEGIEEILRTGVPFFRAAAELHPSSRVP